MFDAYAILGIPRSASPREIKSAYRRLARKHHPDVSTNADSKLDFVRIHEAYQILSRTASRKLYDQYLARQERSEEWLQREAAIEARADEMVAEILERDRAEIRARGEAVSVVTTLLLSTFLAALAQPILSLGWLARGVLAGWAIYGAYYLARSLQRAFLRYTYVPPRLSVTRPVEPPAEPFTRTEAALMLGAAYVMALALGALLGELAEGSIWMLFDRGSVAAIFVFPPIAVFIVDKLRQFDDRR